MTSPAILLAFTLSGVAGLTYEVVWARYLGLFVGHGAYAQVLVLAVYLGGMALGSWAVSDLSRKVRRPLMWYVGAEGALALLGWGFHPAFIHVTDLAYSTLFPALPSAQMVGALRWGLAGTLLLPQAMVLGATFPLMATALVRSDTAQPGRGVATAYLFNTLGGALGVLLAGFWLVGALGLPGTLAAAGFLNFSAAVLAWWASRRHAGETEAAPVHAPGNLAREGTSGERPPLRLTATLLVVTFGTALASFTYEVGWIRMLSLLLGGATHAFELMLSAFILGIALGAYVIQSRADRAPDPVSLLGWIQVAMGTAAVLTLPVYGASFEAMAALTSRLGGREWAYPLFNILRYGLCLGVMLPATLLAGTTLPLITGTLLRRGAGDQAIGRVFALNTVGSVAGAGLAGLVALPLLGLKGLMVAGAALDLTLGVLVLERVAAWRGRSRGLAVAAGTGGTLLFAAVILGVHLDRRVLTSGVFRYGVIPAESDVRMLFYKDGRTATVSTHLWRPDGTLVLATNGKPDASVQTRWLESGRDSLPPTPLDAGQDFTTQVLGPMTGLAHVPGARSVAVVGHGSGMSGTALLASPALERLVTVEIEPAMVEASFTFLPANAAVFDDPRSSFVFDDAKSFFAHRRERFDMVFAEPSNPWVSGTASLFTREFYAGVRSYLAPGGVLVQWIQLYEMTDPLFLGVAKALAESFPHYRGYLVGDADVMIVAATDTLHDPDWSVLDTPGFRAVTAGMPPFTPEHMEALLLFDEATLDGVLREGVEANSDFHPLLDLGAERARFLQRNAEGLYSLATNRFDLRRMLAEERRPPLPYQPVPSRGLEPLVSWERGAWLREALEAGGGIAPEGDPEWSSSLLELKAFLEPMALSDPPASWGAWLQALDRVERQLHWGTAGWANEVFYARTYAYVARAGAPPEVRAVLDLLHGGALFEWTEAAAAADILVGRVALGERWIRPTVLLDVAIVAYLKTGRVADARRAWGALHTRTGRRSDNLRDRILAAAVAEADDGQKTGSHPTPRAARSAVIPAGAAWNARRAAHADPSTREAASTLIRPDARTIPRNSAPAVSRMSPRARTTPEKRVPTRSTSPRATIRP